VTLALLRFGADTKSARLLKDLAATPPAELLLERLADALHIRPESRPRQFKIARAMAVRALERGRKAGLSLIAWHDVAMSQLLLQIPDPPVVLWCAGDSQALRRPGVAIVGSRRATPAGLNMAGKLARGLSAAGLIVTSGLARGVDAAAHEGALKAGGPTIAVLGSGADVIYPPEHAGLAQRIRLEGAVVSEFPPGVPALPHHFPLRNRIISGLSQAVVLIEASDRSGSLITARAALEQGRDVLVVPGNPASGHYAGSHALIKDGAALVETVQDVLDAIRWTSPVSDGSKLNEISSLEALMPEGETVTVDRLSSQTGLETSVLLAELGKLELAGRILRVPGAGFVKLDNSAIGGGNG
jgi:DNA processing protein